MAFHRRKLLDPDSYCQAYCTAAPCPAGCVTVCPETTCAEQINQSPPPPLLPPPPTSTSIILNKSPPLSLLLIASLSVLATAFLIFTCYTVYKFYTIWRKSRRRSPPQPRRPEEEDGDDSFDEEVYGPAVDHPIWHIRTVGLQPSVINAITIVKYKKSDGLVDGTDCAVCLSEFQDDETVRLLPKCSHAFHIPCIDTWLASHTNCPMCRAGIVSGDTADPSPAAHDSEEAQPEAPAEARIEIEECKMDEVQQLVRRSVSLDSISASMISAAVANAMSESNKELGKGKESDVGRRSVGMNRPSFERGVQIGSSSIKRSASCSAKVFLSRHSSRN